MSSFFGRWRVLRAGPCLLVLYTLMACGSPGSSFARANSLDGALLEVKQLNIIAPDNLRMEFPVVFDRLAKGRSGKAGSPAVDVVVVAASDSELPDAVSTSLKRPQSFWLDVDAESRRIRVVSDSTAGLLLGLNRLSKLLNRGDSRIRSGHMLDWPEHALRAMHITLRDVTVPMIIRVVDDAADAGFNTLVLQLADAVDFVHPAVRPRSNALSVDQLLRAVNYARQSGMRVIPEVKLLSHQEKFLGDGYPELMYNQITYDPRKQEVYTLIFGYLDAVIEVLQPDAIHVGHDEIRGFTDEQREKFLLRDESALPAALFLQDVNRIYDYLSARDIEMWMWGDMLIAPQEFPRMRQRHLHGNASYAAVRNDMPKEIIICDWHYKDETDFSSTQAYADEGFRVLGATWKTKSSSRAFSQFVAGMEPAGAGMMATSWWHLRRRDWDAMEHIVEDNGQAFWYGR